MQQERGKALSIRKSHFTIRADSQYSLRRADIIRWASGYGNRVVDPEIGLPSRIAETLIWGFRLDQHELGEIAKLRYQAAIPVLTSLVANEQILLAVKVPPDFSEIIYFLSVSCPLLLLLFRKCQI